VTKGLGEAEALQSASYWHAPVSWPLPLLSSLPHPGFHHPFFLVSSSYTTFSPIFPSNRIDQHYAGGIVQQKTDGELTVLARSGDKQAFGELLERYQAMAIRIARG
jgi:hypothetical protein